MFDKIGIICASDEELEPFFKYMDIENIKEKAMLKFYEGTIHHVRVVVLYCGVCKVNAAIASQILIDEFQAGMIINAGTAGGMSESIGIFDTVISEQVAYHDVDEEIITDFHPWMETAYFQSSKNLIAVAKEYSHTSSHPIFFGKSVTGEQFIEDDKRASINEIFDPLSVDMETAAIAHVCHVNQIPFIPIRTITDTAEHKGVENFEENCKTASEISAGIVVDLLAKFAAEGK